MPIFEYTCLKCGKEFERLVLGKDVEVRCPSCEATEVSKHFSTFAFKSGTKFVASAGPSCGPCVPPTPSACTACPSMTKR